MEFVSPDGSFGFGGFEGKVGEEAMMSILMPDILDLGKEAFMDHDILAEIDKVMLEKYPDFDADDEEDGLSPSGVVCAVLAIKKYNLSLDSAVVLLHDGGMIEWVFKKFVQQNGSNMDQVLGDIPTVSVNIGEGVEVGGTENIPDDVKIGMMVSLIEQFKSLVTSKDEVFNYRLGKMYDRLKTLYHREDFPMIGTFTLMLNWRYKVDLKECIKLALEGKVIDECYKKFLEETGTEVASDMMGESPSASVN